MSLAVIPRQYTFDQNGAPRVGAEWAFYEAGTDTPILLYTTAALTVTQANPVESLEGGGFPAVYIDSEDHPTHTQVMLDANGLTIFSEDGIESDAAGTLRSDLASAVASDDGARLIGYRRTEAGSVASTVYLHLRERINVVADFNAAGDSDGTAGNGTDDTAAFQAAFSALQAAGGGRIIVPPRRYRIVLPGVAVTGGTPLGAFTDLRGVAFEMDGSEFVVDSTYTGSQFVEMLKFTDCKNVDIDHLLVNRTSAEPAGETASRGVEVLKFWDACEGIKIGCVEAERARSAVMFRRNALVDGKAKRIAIETIKAKDTGYGYNGVQSGDHLRIGSIEADTPTRSFYVYGVDDFRVRIKSKNHTGNGDVLLATGNGIGCSNGEIKYINTESTIADNSVNGVRLEYDATANCAMRGISVDLDIAGTASYYIGYGAMVTKSDSVNQTLEDFEITGSINGVHANHRTVAICTGAGTWGSGDTLRNLSFRKLRLNASSQPVFNLVGLKDAAVFNGVQATSALDITGNSSTRIAHIGCNYESGVLSASNQDFVSTLLTGVLTNTNGLSASATYDPGSLADGAGVTTTVTCTGAAAGDFALASFSLDVQGITVTAWVSTANTVSVRFQNESGGVLDLSSGTLRVRVYQK
jgi:hypothetical protein